MRFAFTAGLLFFLVTSAVAHTAPLLPRHANHTVGLNSTSVAAVNGSHTAANSTTFGQDDGDCDDDESGGIPSTDSTIGASSTMPANTSSPSNWSSESTDYDCEDEADESGATASGTVSTAPANSTGVAAPDSSDDDTDCDGEDGSSTVSGTSPSMSVFASTLPVAASSSAASPPAASSSGVAAAVLAQQAPSSSSAATAAPSSAGAEGCGGVRPLM
jgi:hypothetical protein